MRVDTDTTCRRLAALSGGLILSSSLNRRGGNVRVPGWRLRMHWHRYIDGVISGKKQNNTPSTLLLWKKDHFHVLR